MTFGSALPAPTKAEALRMALVVEAGCICCWAWAQLATPCEVHHLTVGGKHGAPRRGHAFTIGACPWHHRGVGSPALEAQVGPSYAAAPLPFRRAFGGDGRLLEIQSGRLAAVASTYLISRGRYADPVLPGGLSP